MQYLRDIIILTKWSKSSLSEIDMHMHYLSISNSQTVILIN